MMSPVTTAGDPKPDQTDAPTEAQVAAQATPGEASRRLATSRRASRVRSIGSRDFSPPEGTLDLRFDGTQAYAEPAGERAAYANLLDRYRVDHADVDGYGEVAGNASLREALADIFSVRADQVVVTSGASEALHLAMLCLADPGEAVALPAPAFPGYVELARLCGLDAVHYDATGLPGTQPGHLLPPGTTPGALPTAASSASLARGRPVQLQIVCSPHNPTGLTWLPRIDSAGSNSAGSNSAGSNSARSDLASADSARGDVSRMGPDEMLAGLPQHEREGLISAAFDEIPRGEGGWTLWDVSHLGVPAIDTASTALLQRLRAGMGERDVVVFSLSKLLGLPGARLGCLISSCPEVIDAVVRVKTHIAMATSRLSQSLAIGMLRDPGYRAELAARHHVLDQHRAKIYAAVSASSGLWCPRPRGGSHVLISPVSPAESQAYLTLMESPLAVGEPGSRVEYPSLDPRALWTELRVAGLNGLPGDVFGSPYPGVRLCVAQPPDVVDAAAEILAAR